MREFENMSYRQREFIKNIDREIDEIVINIITGEESCNIEKLHKVRDKVLYELYLYFDLNSDVERLKFMKSLLYLNDRIYFVDNIIRLERIKFFL